MSIKFSLYHEKEKLYAIFTVNGEENKIDATDYFNSSNPHDDWLDYRLGLKDLTKKENINFIK